MKKKGNEKKTEPTAKPPSLLARIAALREMPKEQLREQWRTLFGKEPPAYNRPFMIKRLIYRLQELEFGGLKTETREHMNQLLDNAGLDVLAGRKKAKKKRRRDAAELIAGTLLVREWRGRNYEVKVLADGFEYDGRKYRSLSGIAKDITGTSWNGLAFFGLSTQKSSKAAK
jgi:hypothetical protein